MKTQRKKWTALLLLLLLVPISVVLFRYMTIHITYYSGQWTYTMSDDGEQYRIRWPALVIKPFTSSFKVNESRLLFFPEEMEQPARDGSALRSEYMQRYHGHFNLDYAIERKNDQIIVTYMGYGKLDDGTIETIDKVYSYPYFSFEDKTEGQWIPEGYPWEAYVAPPYQDPKQVVDPFFSD